MSVSCHWLEVELTFVLTRAESIQHVVSKTLSRHLKGTFWAGRRDGAPCCVSSVSAASHLKILFLKMLSNTLTQRLIIKQVVGLMLPSCPDVAVMSTAACRGRRQILTLCILLRKLPGVSPLTPSSGSADGSQGEAEELLCKDNNIFFSEQCFTQGNGNKIKSKI